MVASVRARTKSKTKWVRGQATFYPYIDAGSCGYGKLDKRMPTGRYIVAISDKVKGYREMCGTCFQVLCEPRMVYDHQRRAYHGAPYACKRPRKSIIVMVTDECTCKGNKKWCCDKKLTHLDLSAEAFKKLGDVTKSGAMAVRFKKVACPGAKKRRRAQANRRRRCRKTVGPWRQCGGIATNNKAWQKDGPWPTTCCKPFLSCKRKTKFFWYCKR